MRSAPSPVSIPWLRADEAIQVVTVASLPCHWVSHWAPELNRAVKCRGVDCLWCNRGIEQQLRVVVGVVQHGRTRLLFEFRERHRPVFESLYDLGESALGCRLKVWKKGAAKNSPIQVELLEERGKVADAWDIEALVDALGVQATPTPLKESPVPAEGRLRSSSVPATSPVESDRVRATEG